MELSPRDLGTDRYMAVMRRRLSTLPNNAGQNGQTFHDDAPLTGRAKRRGRRLRRYWVRDLHLDEETAEALGEVTWKGAPGVGVRVASIIFSTYLAMGTVIAMASGNFFVGLLVIAAWALLVGGLMYSPRVAVRKQHQRALTRSDVDALVPVTRGRLERTYLNLVGDAMRQEIPSETARTDIRAALRDLGDAISKLPTDSVPTADPEQLRREAAERRQLANVEADSVVRASLLRQAESYERRAALGAENSTSSRRASALRREARAQMDALRSVLLAFEHTSATDALAVAHLSETVSRVAREAQAASIARRELEEGELASLLGHPLPDNLPLQPVPAGRPITKVETPAPVVQTRNWWRGQS